MPRTTRALGPDLGAARRFVGSASPSRYSNDITARAAPSDAVACLTPRAGLQTLGNRKTIGGSELRAILFLSREGGGGSMNDSRAGLKRWTVPIFVLSLGTLMLHAFIPFEQFVHRGDDAFYYFKLAVNHPRTGFWTFDSINPTNGVQPLWAILLTAVAYPLSWLGIDDPHAARIFVGLTVLCHFGAVVALFHVLSRRVSVGVAVAAAAAFLFSQDLVWRRVWGMENSLYALLLTVTAGYFEIVFSKSPTRRTALGLGALLGLTALARLNAGLFVVTVLAYVLWTRRLERPVNERIRLAAVAGATAALFIVPYLGWNYATTGHLLPVSGVAKAIPARDYLSAGHIESVWSTDFLGALHRDFQPILEKYFRSRALDGFAIVGLRRLAMRLGDTRWVSMWFVPVAAGAVMLLLPCVAGRPREWLRYLRERLGRLSPFSYVAAFAVLNIVVSILLYPNPRALNYGMLSWWFVELEIVWVVLVATLVATSLGYLAGRFVAARWHIWLLAGVLLFHTVLFGRGMVLGYWDRRINHPTWNDQMHHASRWMADHLPADARVGSWNAGVLGYYSRQRVTNLDGLINGFGLLPYLARHDVSGYIRAEGLDYLSDRDKEFKDHVHGHDLELTEVYSHFSPLWKQHYKIYRVEKR